MGFSLQGRMTAKPSRSGVDIMGLFRFAAAAGRVLGGSRITDQDGSQPVPRAPTGSAILNEFKKLGLRGSPAST
ncbi:hypothetical protein NFI95_00825 [Acetobacteraceae bacterium KSS8]|uniref:Uncharacterized protein n=1 Tax=Endosaccharibacter trunci TaxID=2812733 RepID=A0ABT1W5B1_9PROT|nr:hypothetical protein [Acetobacteraceae bacterium KSS8]